MTAEQTEFESEVRQLVARVLAGVLDGPAPAASRLDSDRGEFWRE